MGISKRNPRGNFNWQSRILKKKAICCGQLNEPIDCGIFAPIPIVTSDRLCVTTPPSTQTISGGNAAAAPPDFAQFYDNTFTLYKDGVAIDTQFVPIGAYSYSFTGTLASAGSYELEITNRFGCTAKSSPVQIDAFQTPVVVGTGISSTIACIPPPIGGPGDGSVTLTVTNPVPGYTYIYNLCYDLGPPIYSVCLPAETTTALSVTFTDLCNIRYLGYVCVEVNGTGQCCSTIIEINI
jgi:hypothetical protein